MRPSRYCGLRGNYATYILYYILKFKYILSSSSVRPSRYCGLRGNYAKHILHYILQFKYICLVCE